MIMKEDVTRWLYLGNRLIQSVLISPDATDREIKDKAIDEFDRFPGLFCDAQSAPYIHRARRLNARVVRY